jgi:hypothetical protein
MTCKKITKNDSICKTKIGKNKYTVVLRRKGRHGGYFINEYKSGVSLGTANSLIKKWTREARSFKGVRRTPYP